MDHICPCNVLKKSSSDVPYYRNVQWFDRPGQFSGTLVKILKFYSNNFNKNLNVY